MLPQLGHLLQWRWQLGQNFVPQPEQLRIESLPAAKSDEQFGHLVSSMFVTSSFFMN